MGNQVAKVAKDSGAETGETGDKESPQAPALWIASAEVGPEAKEEMAAKAGQEASGVEVATGEIFWL